MKKLNIILIACVAGIGLTSSCKKDGACRGYVGYALSIQDEASALSNAGSAYAKDSTTANCEAYKAAYRDYIDELEDQSKCVPSSEKSDYQQSLDEARQDLDKIKC